MYNENYDFILQQPKPKCSITHKSWVTSADIQFSLVFGWIWAKNMYFLYPLVRSWHLIHTISGYFRFKPAAFSVRTAYSAKKWWKRAGIYWETAPSLHKSSVKRVEGCIANLWICDSCSLSVVKLRLFMHMWASPQPHVTTFDARINHILPFARATVYYVLCVMWTKKLRCMLGKGWIRCRERRRTLAESEVDFYSMGWNRLLTTVHPYLYIFGGCGFLLEKVDPLRLDLRRVDCWQAALTARTDEPLHLLEWWEWYICCGWLGATYIFNLLIIASSWDHVMLAKERCT